MKKFLLGLAVYATALTLLGGGLGVAEADAKTVMVYCAPKSKVVKYPHFNGTRVRCYAPRFWVRVRYKWAIRIGTYPILLANRPSVCIGGKPKIARSPGASSWRLVGQRCAKQVIQ